MPIHSGNIKLMAPERLTDADDGGGMMSANEVIDGQENNLFPDISQLDRTNGDVGMRKVFLHVNTDDDDVFYGTNLIISEPPNDPLVNAIAFEMGGYASERRAAQEHIERYVVRGPLASWHLYGTHVDGQASIRLYGRTDRAMPEVGDVYTILEMEGSAEEQEQYVRITSVEYEDQQFTLDQQGTFTRRIVTCNLSDALRYTFHGPAISKWDSPEENHQAFVHETTVADAARYKGVKALTAAASLGAIQVALGSPFGQLVPSTRGETPLTAQNAGMGATVTIDAGSREVEISQISQTGYIGIGLGNRASNYVFVCRPLPAAGTVRVAYRALGKWYSIADQGDGTLAGDGAGSIDYLTGTLLVTLAALPDVDSSILVQWGTPLNYRVRAGQSIGQVTIRHTCSQGALARNTVTASWYSNAVQVSVSDDGSGNLSGTGGTGEVQYSSGELVIWPSAMPDPSSELRVNANHGDPVTENWSSIARQPDGTLDLTLGQTPVIPNSLRLRYLATMRVPPEQTRTLIVQVQPEDEDDGIPRFNHVI